MKKRETVMSKTISGLEHEAIDKISAAILACEMGESGKEKNHLTIMRELLVSTIGIVVEIRLLHDRLIADLEKKED